LSGFNGVECDETFTERSSQSRIHAIDVGGTTTTKSVSKSLHKHPQDVESGDIDKPGAGSKYYKDAIMSMGSRSKRGVAGMLSDKRKGAVSVGALVSEDAFDAARNYLVSDDVVIFDAEEDAVSEVTAENLNFSSKRSAHSSSPIRDELIGILDDSSFLENASASSSVDLFSSHDDCMVVKCKRNYKANTDVRRKRIRDSDDDGVCSIELPSLSSTVPELPLSRDRSFVSGRSRSSTDSVWIRVTVNSWVAAVPIEPSQYSENVKWLEDQVALRYYERHKKRPFLTLCTTDGAELSKSDPISLVIDEYSELIGKVDRWELISLEESYVENCRQMNLEVYPTMKTLMTSFESSGVVSFTHFSLQGELLHCVLRSFQAEYR
ncbi:unnamed protein product, partial [Soboliphyme baturini]|uniref:Tudor domain-containing protein n=1 Tax=Soboliphyme baturini TaxID=241478 RepID=A0A183J6L9_9BILA